MLLMGLGIVLLRPPIAWKTKLWGPLAASLVVIAVSVMLTWQPYFQAVSPARLLGLHPYGQLNGLQMLRAAGMAVLGFPSTGRCNGPTSLSEQ